MVCFRLSKKNFLKLTLSLLMAFIILLGGIDHADASTWASSTSLGSQNVSWNTANNACIAMGGNWQLPATTTLYNKILEQVQNNNVGIFPVCGGSVCNEFSGETVSGQHAVIYSSSGSVYVSGGWNDTPYNGADYYYTCYSPEDILGCMDNMAVNYDPTATVDSGCYYVLPTETATSTRIISVIYSTTTNTVDLSYYVATSSPVSLYLENRNERDGVINSAFSTTTTGLTDVYNIPVTLPNPLSGAGYTYLTTKLVLASDHGVIYDWHTLTLDLENGVNLGGGGYQQAECSITNLGGCFVNGLATMFYPSQGALNNFNTFVELIKTKPPIGYFYVVKNNLNNLSSTSTSAFTVTIPSHIKQYLFTPFDVAIGSILWFFFAINFYKRLKHITV